MTELTGDPGSRLEMAVAPGFRDRLLDKGLARGLIWRDGVLPPGSPHFSPSLTADLLDYGYAVLAMALRGHGSASQARSPSRAFLVAGEAIEAAVHRGRAGPDYGFHRVSAAVAFHLATYAARAYSMLPVGADAENLSPTESVLVGLLRRNLDDMYVAYSSWLLDSEHQDERIAARLREDDDFDEADAAHLVIVSSFMRGIALFDHALTTGEASSAAAAQRRLSLTANAAAELHAVGHWWTATLACHLIDELWEMSFHRRIPVLQSDHEDAALWNELRRGYITRLHAEKRAAIELWPSQLEAAARAVDPEDDLVVALPTSAGKTRVAELCILRALASGMRTVYVTPLRALSAQAERDLEDTFLPLGFSVSSLYGSTGIENDDSEVLRQGDIVVSTPEKLDFALRNDPSIIDDVGLVVLDEGHMLGPNEREVRYEALVQRILRRDDALARRIVCLSALFPAPEEMSDLVGWIRQDQPGGPVHSTWRPTRQRFGVLQWQSNAARLDVKVEGEASFVPRFIEARDPPQESRRRKAFPRDKNELVLAAAWRFVEQGKDVLIYCSLRKSVEALGRLVLDCGRHGLLQPLRTAAAPVEQAMAVGEEWLGQDHPAVQCLRYGVALHHAGLPRQFLTEVERLLRSGECPVTIASPTVAQGLNLSASVLLVPSIWRYPGIIPPGEFANVAGRAGRAFVDVEGLVLHLVWEGDADRRRRALRDWERLVRDAKAPRVASGLLLLTETILGRIAQAANVPLDEAVDYITGHVEGWVFADSAAYGEELDASQWDRDVASLDTAILSLLDADEDDVRLEAALDDVLGGSLFARELARKAEAVQTLLVAFLAARSRYIWSRTRSEQRSGYHAAGIGLAAGQFLDEHLGVLVDLLLRAESAILDGDSDVAGDAITGFAELVFRTAPFRPPQRHLPAGWNVAMRAWVLGKAASDVIELGGVDGVGMLQDAFTYRLPWAMEAVRVHANAVDHEGASDLWGTAAMAAQAGSADVSAITLLRSGLASREGAIAAVTSTDASFSDRPEMSNWLASPEVARRSSDPDWPTALSHTKWIEFYRRHSDSDMRRWSRETQGVRVKWTGDVPAPGFRVVIQGGDAGQRALVLAPDFTQLGLVTSLMRRSRRDIVGARVGPDSATVMIEYFGPPARSR